MTDINEIKFSGVIERLQAVTTKTGTNMARWLLKVGQDRFKCIAFKNVADAVLQCNDGDRINVTGTGAINSWKDSEERWHNDFQMSCWIVEINGQQVKYEKSEPAKQQRASARSRKPRQQSIPGSPVLTPAPANDRDPNQFDYSGGPF